MKKCLIYEKSEKISDDMCSWKIKYYELLSSWLYEKILNIIYEKYIL